MKNKLDYVKKGIKAKGKLDLINYLKGKRLTQREAILAHCYECMGYYYGGKEECQNPECPLYPYMPYVGYKEGDEDTEEKK